MILSAVGNLGLSFSLSGIQTTLYADLLTHGMDPVASWALCLEVKNVSANITDTSQFLQVDDCRPPASFIHSQLINREYCVPGFRVRGHADLDRQGSVPSLVKAVQSY